MMKANDGLLSSLLGKIKISPRVWFFASALALFPFISTVTGASIKIAGLEIWKYLWLLWLFGLAIHIVVGKGFFDRFGSQVEVFLWLVIAFMLLVAPEPDMVIDPWKNWFFTVLVLVFVRFLVRADAHEIKVMVKTALVIWWGYALLLVVYVLSQPAYPGAIQHQFFLSGMLGFAATLLLLFYKPADASNETDLLRVLFVTAVVNVVLNLTVTETRSVFPFSLALLLITALWLRRSSAVMMMPLRHLGLPLALLLAILPIFHLSGAAGNLLNEWSYPIFGKLRTVESSTGREAAFQVWQSFVRQEARPLGPAAAAMPTIQQEADEARPLGPAAAAMPTIQQEADEARPPILGMSSEQIEEARRKGRDMQTFYAQRQKDLGVELDIPNLAITSSHNLWLDATARSGVVYALGIFGAFCFVVWRISMSLSARLPAGLAFAYWSMAAAWGIASQFDEAHWLYHTPYLTLFFLPVLASAIRERGMLGSEKHFA